MKGTERQVEAITNHDKSFIVTAGAGTGKTYVLVNKYLDLLENFGAKTKEISKRLSVHNILALTFTDKAAAEMKGRIREVLDEKEGKYWETARIEFLTAPVQTFHSFCAGVLREFAYEAGLDPSFVVLDGRESSRILSLSFESLIHTPTGGETGEAIIKTLSIAGPYSLENMVRYLYSRREEAEQFLVRISHDPGLVIKKWQEKIAEFKETEVKNIRNNPVFTETVNSMLSFASMDVSQDDKAMVYLQEVSSSLKIMLNAGTTDEFLMASGSYLHKKLGNVGSRKTWGEDVLSELKVTYKSLNGLLKRTEKLQHLSFDPGSPLDDLTIQFLQLLGVTFGQFCAIIDKEKASAGGMDFSDLVRHTRKLFRTHHDLVASYYSERFRYILIDEFQDTDPTQFEIVKTLIGELSPGLDRLFIVGDPKQSIYLFRDADVTRFLDAQLLITRDCDGKEIPLDVCFRSSPDIISFVNILFSHLFSSSEKPWEFKYDRISTSFERKDHKGTVELLLIGEETGITEYDAVADKIGEIIRNETEVYEEGSRDNNGVRTFFKRPASYGDIAVLLERRTDIGFYLHALAKRNIPYYVHKGTGFYSRQEILDLISLLSFLLRPYDDVHLFGLLRSPYFGLSDLNLLKISQYPGKFFFEKLQKSIPDYPENEKACSLLSSWLTRAGRFRLAPLIQSVLDESGITAVYGGLVEGKQILSNTDKLLQIVRSREEKSNYQLADLVEDLLDSVDREEEEGEAMVDDPDLDAVIIMTVHASKGLEFPIVIVPDMASRPNMRHGPLLMDREGSLVGLQLPNPDDNFSNAETPVYTVLKSELEEKLLAEKKRLLYVALTRAADHLVMSGVINNEFPAGSHNTRFDWIIPALGITRPPASPGKITLSSDHGDIVGLKVTICQPKEPVSSLSAPPFVLSEELRSSNGKFVKAQLTAVPDKIKPVTVTGLTHQLSGKQAIGRDNDPGDRADFGTAVHEVLRGHDPEIIIQEYGVMDSDNQELLKSVRNDFGSLSILKNIRNIKKEFAFTVNIGGFPVTGQVDLIVLLEDETWMVIDYKSDTIPGEEIAENESYRHQVEIYRRAAEILGMAPAMGAIYSVREKRLIEIEQIPDDVFFNLFIPG